MKRYLFTLFVILFSPFVWAQQRLANTAQEDVNEFYSNYHLALQANETYSFERDKLISSISFTRSVPWGATGAYVLIDGIKYDVVPDIHMDDGDIRYFSQLIILEKPANHVQLFSGELVGDVEMQLYFVPTIDVDESKLGPSTLRIEGDACSTEPKPILQEVWREGLPEPNYTRSFTKVKHVIVHHSAGANYDIDHLKTVRNIYTFHTQGHGWSDIGYNYLVAYDGTLYTGRDPDGGEQDNVLGAHFCGSNSGTMGICVLGNFEEAKVSEASLATLKQLICWKLKKEGLNPLAYSSHSLNPNLGVIAGHRDGCLTACPGQDLYDNLEGIRYALADSLDFHDLPAPTQWIDIAESICALSSLDVEVGAVTGALDYEWAYSGSGVSINASGTNATLNFDGNATSGTVSCRAIHKDGTSAPLNYNINVQHVPGLPQFVKKVSQVPFDTAKVVYEVELVENVSYKWNYTGMYQELKANENVAEFVPGPFATDGLLEVTLINNCGSTTGGLPLVMVVGEPIVFPNPLIGNTLKVRGDNLGQTTKAVLYTTQGKKLPLIVERVDEGFLNINIDPLPIGVYVLVVKGKNGGHMLERKIVVR